MVAGKPIRSLRLQSSEKESARTAIRTQRNPTIRIPFSLHADGAQSL